MNIKDLNTAEKHQKVEDLIGQIKGVIFNEVNILTSSVKIKYYKDKCKVRDIIEQLEDEGFNAELKVKNEDNDIRKISA